MKGGQRVRGSVLISPRAVLGLAAVISRLDLMGQVERTLSSPRYEETRIQVDEALQAVQQEAAAIASDRGNETAKHRAAKLAGDSKVMTVQEAADLLDVTPQYVRQLCAQGLLEATQPHRGSRWQINPSSVLIRKAATERNTDR